MSRSSTGTAWSQGSYVAETVPVSIEQDYVAAEV
jgi:hypothetical protein